MTAQPAPVTPPPERPPIGSHVFLTGSQHPHPVLVTGHTERGFTYAGGLPLSIPRLGIHGTREGEAFCDLPWFKAWSMSHYAPPPAPSCPTEQGEGWNMVTRSPADWLELLQRCQNGHASCMFVLGAINDELALSRQPAPSGDASGQIAGGAPAYVNHLAEKEARIASLEAELADRKLITEDHHRQLAAREAEVARLHAERTGEVSVMNAKLADAWSERDELKREVESWEKMLKADIRPALLVGGGEDALIKALRDYIDYLHECDSMTSGYLYAHNWRFPASHIERGRKLRETIADAQAAIAATTAKEGKNL